MFCMKCGVGLENGRCPNCGFVDEIGTVPSQKPQLQKPQPQQSGYYGASGAYPYPRPEPSLQTQRPQQPGYYGYTGAYPPPFSETPAGKRTRIKKEKTQRTGKKKRKLAIILSSVAFALIAGGLITGYLLLDEEYNDAIKHLDKDRLKVAATSFEEILWFKESEEYLEKCNTLIAYHEAEDTYDSKEYEEALKLFDDLGDYDDSEDYAQLCRNYIDYNEANTLFETLSYEQAKVIFVALGDFEDSINMAESCQVNIDYIKAKENFEHKDYAAAKALFETIPDFEDSSDMMFICGLLIEYEEVLDTYNNGEYDVVLQKLADIEDEISESDIDLENLISVDEIKYIRGQCFFKKELYFSAYKVFKEVGDYLDAAKMAENCIQPLPKPGELFRHEDYSKETWRTKFIWTEETDYDAYVMIYEDDLLISVCFVERNELLRVWYPYGTYRFEIFYGDIWFGVKEMFGNTEYDEVVTKTTRTTMSTKVFLGLK